MNCPQCQQPVGHDQYHMGGAWIAVHDASGLAVAMERDIHVHCDHCGLYELKQDHTNAITSTKRVNDPRDIKRIERLIPACRMDRRVAC